MSATDTQTHQQETDSRWQQVSRDLMSSVVVFLIAVPLCMGIAIASGAPVSAGLVTGIVGGLIVAPLAGCRLNVSGPAAGLSVIVFEAIMQFGLEMLGLVVLLSGLLQLLAGGLRLGRWFRAVSPAVVQGMLAGIGVLIFASQFHVMLDDSPKDNGIDNLLTIPQAIAKAAELPQVPSGDARQHLRSILQEIGDLHRRQVNLNERVTERIPDHRERLRGNGEISIEELADEQRAINKDFQRIFERGLLIFGDQPEKRKRIVTSGNQVAQVLQVCLEDLESNRATHIMPVQEEAAAALSSFQSAFKNHELGALVGIITILSLVLWRALARGKFALIPPQLVAVLLATGVATFWQLPVVYVEVPSSILEEIHAVKFSTLADAPWSGIITSAIVLSLAGSAQSLFSATAVDQMHHGPRTNYDRELIALGVGNSVCGLLGALPMTTEIVRSSTNAMTGGRTRLASFLHGVWLLLFVVLLSPLLRMIPVAVLAAILVHTGYRLLNLKGLKHLATYGWGEVVIWFVTVIVIVADDLLTGVLVGLGLAVFKLVISFNKLSVQLDKEASGKRLVVRLDGVASFMRLPKLSKKLDAVPADAHVSFDVFGLSYLDQACVELLETWSEQHQNKGGQVDVDWDLLEDFAQHGPRRQQPATVPATEVAGRE